MRRRTLPVLALLLALVRLGPPVSAQELELAAPDPVRARAAAAELRALGDAAHELVWEGFAAAPVQERRARARWVLESASARTLGQAAAHLADPDAEVRASLAAYLGRAPAGDESGRRLALEALAEAGREEPSSAVRTALTRALVATGGPRAAAVLAELCALWPAPDRTEVAAALGEVHGAGEVVVELVRSALEPGVGPPVPPDVLAALLPAWARQLADREGPGTPRDRAALALALRHPEPRVRLAAQDALETAVARLRVLDRPERADTLLAALAREGPDPAAGAYGRAVQALQEGLDPAVALAAARELERLAGAGLGRAQRRWRALAAYLAGLAHLAAGEPEACARELDRTEELLRALAAERADLASEGGLDQQLELVHQLALVRVARAVQLLAAGRGPQDAELLEGLRRAHELELEAQLLALRGDRDAVSHLDVLVESSLSPYRLVFARKPHAAWPTDRCLDAQQALGRALATIAPLEAIGFEPIAGALPGRADPLEDPARRRLLGLILEERAASAWRAYMEALNELLRRAAESRSIGADDEQELMLLDQRHRVRKMAADEGDLEKHYDELRGPSWLGLRLAQDLREEGRTRECRELGGRMLVSIEERELEQRFSFGLQLAAEVQITIGSSWTADDEPTRATAELEKAVERLESLEEFYVERGVPQLVEVARSTRANALVSLAVNANVKLEDSEKARAYFEEAYDLRQDDFMRVLLACYRARSGLGDQAREILAEVPHAPRFYYNLACTYALLGDRERALDLLERELAENHPSPGSLEQQKDWARRDPDLAALREDPRFRYLVGDEER